MKLLIPVKRERLVSPLPVRERIKVRVLVQRAILFTRDLRFRFPESSPTLSSSSAHHSIGILNRALKETRCIRTLTSTLSLTGRGEEGSGILRFVLNDTGTGRGDAAAS